MRKTTLIALWALLLTTFSPAAPAQAGPRERKIKRLESQIKTLQYTMRRAMEFRAKYATLRANSTFLDRLLQQDWKLLNVLVRSLNNPVTLTDAFLSWVKNDFKKAKSQRGKYNPPSTYLWLDCRFGLQAVKARSYFTVRVDVVDSQSGVRIYQSLSPYQRRISRAKQAIPVQIKGLRVAGGKYQLRVQIEVGRGRVKRLVKYYHNTAWRRR